MARPTDEVTSAALKHLRSYAEEEQADLIRKEVDASLDVLERAVVLPPLLGTTDAANVLGVASGNLSKVSGLPDPLYTLRVGKFYEAAAIHALAKKRRRAAVPA